MKTVVFDFGNVIAFFDHRRAVAQLAKFTDVPPAELTLQLYGSPIEDQYERGHITTAEYVRLAKSSGRLTCTDAEFLTAFVDIFWRNDAVCDLIPRLAARYRLVLASNTNDAHFTKFTAQFADVLQEKHFPRLCASHFGRCRKPEPEYFAYLQRHVAADPGECVFVDDLPANVEAGRRHGWRGIVYRPDDDLAAMLRAEGLEID
ncbi:MAG: HAD family hydrolase [Fimbriiglobus sp.]